MYATPFDSYTCKFGFERGSASPATNVTALHCKKYILNTVNSGLFEFFRASAICSKILNVKRIFNTVKNFRGSSVFQGKRKSLKNPEQWKYFQ